MLFNAKELREIANENNSDAFQVICQMQAIMAEAALKGKDGVIWVSCKCLDDGLGYIGKCNGVAIRPLLFKVETQAAIQMLKDAKYTVKKISESDYIVTW